jgi:hypothetical protein
MVQPIRLGRWTPFRKSIQTLVSEFSDGRRSRADLSRPLPNQPPKGPEPGPVKHAEENLLRRPRTSSWPS